mmetsp:Transcript_4846/g.11681  ORF Transcript_4846/g.11681 Transcript_4846/m.11681 type:complete len:467 (-) Transcript_4846:948-2348(-)
MACLIPLASCVACQACTCVGGQICSCLCGLLSKGGPPSREKLAGRWSRVAYLALAIVTILTAGVFRDTGPQTLAGSDIFSKNMRCPDDNDSPTCMGRAFVLRVCFATAVFHLCLGLLTIGASDFSNPRVQLHTALWPMKMGMWLVLHLIVFFIPSSFFLGFGWVALVASIFFLLVQIVIFIEWIYEWNEAWIMLDGADNIGGPWHMIILAVSVACFGLSIGMTVVMFLWFGKNTADPAEEGGCEVYTFFTSFNLILFLFLTVFSFRATEWMPATGIMPSSLVAAFMSFKVLTALYAQTKCNALSGADDESIYKGPPEGLTAISVIIAIVLAAYNSVMISKAWEDGDLGLEAGPTQQKDRTVPLVPMDILDGQQNSQEEGAGASEPEQEPLKGPLGYNVAAFHFAFCLGILYVAMQLTNWNEDYKPGEVDKSRASMWIKVCDSWVLAVAYFWSMIAPKVLTGRNFDL